MDGILFVLFLPLVVLGIYFIGFVISDRKKIVVEDTKKNYIIRFLIGFAVVSVLAVLYILIAKMFQMQY